MSTSAVIDFINLNRDHYVEELKAYLAIPSISALPAHAAYVRRCAEWTQHELERIGIQYARLIETPGHLTDLEAVADGYVSVTPLHLDLTHDESLLPLGRQFES